MTKKEFIEIYAEKTGVVKKEATKQLEAFLSVIEGALVDGDMVQFIGWGTFETKMTKERLGRNPKTGEEIMIPAKRVVKFKAGKNLAEKVNK